MERNFKQKTALWSKELRGIHHDETRVIVSSCMMEAEVISQYGRVI